MKIIIEYFPKSMVAKYSLFKFIIKVRIQVHYQNLNSSSLLLKLKYSLFKFIISKITVFFFLIKFDYETGRFFYLPHSLCRK